MVRHIAFVGYPVFDMQRARRFYEDVLGLKPAESFGEFWQEYDLGEGTFALVVCSGDEVPDCWKTPGASVAFEVDDLDGEVTRLRDLGVPFNVEPFESPVCKAAAIGDTEGNTITLHQSTR